MATFDEIDAALSDAIIALAKSAGTNTASAYALNFAAAANQLAEARAWNTSPHQPHGGSQVKTD